MSIDPASIAVCVKALQHSLMQCLLPQDQVIEIGRGEASRCMNVLTQVLELH